MKILTTGKGKTAVERTLPKGAVYLENDKRERKATGSYYTPDYFVQYIVTHAVGPVLAERLDGLRTELREAQKTLRAKREKARGLQRGPGKADDPEREAFLKHRDLVDRLFDIKVLDPAMGSGHFLVEAVDFITDRMLDFLNGFPWNPVVFQLSDTRDAILAELDAQSVSIDRSEESIEDRVPLLRVELLRQLHRALHVGEQHGDLLALAFEGGFGLQDFVGEMFRGVGAGVAPGG